MLIETLLQMCDRDVVDNHKSCSEYFWLMNRYATMVSTIFTVNSLLTETSVRQDTSLKRTPRVDPCLALLLLVDSLEDGLPKASVVERADCIFVCVF